VRALNYALFVGSGMEVFVGVVITGLVGWINQSYVKEQINWFMTMRPYMRANVLPYVLTAEAERTLKPQASFRECAKDCPEMIVIPTGEFTMGSPATEEGHCDNEGPQHKVMIARLFAVSKFDVTFADWDACVSVGGCHQVSDSGFGRGHKAGNQCHLGRRPAVCGVVLYDDRPALPTAHGGRMGIRGSRWYHDGLFLGRRNQQGNANCIGCGSDWDNRESSPVDRSSPMRSASTTWPATCGNGCKIAKRSAHRWLEWTGGDCSRRVVRGGSWLFNPQGLRSASRFEHTTGTRTDDLGFLVGRTLSARAGAITVAPGEHY
jgi:formylglycine-generating enzyme required for sulfatase activity